MNDRFGFIGYAQFTVNLVPSGKFSMGKYIEEFRFADGRVCTHCGCVHASLIDTYFKIYMLCREGISCYTTDKENIWHRKI